MYSALTAAKIITGAAATEADMPPILIELSKKAHFCRFLEKELNAAKTEAEKEAVRTILMKTKIEIRSMEEKWQRTQAALQQSTPSSSKKVANAYPTHRIQ